MSVPFFSQPVIHVTTKKQKCYDKIHPDPERNKGKKKNLPNFIVCYTMSPSAMTYNTPPPIISLPLIFHKHSVFSPLGLHPKCSLFHYIVDFVGNKTLQLPYYMKQHYWLVQVDRKRADAHSHNWFESIDMFTLKNFSILKPESWSSMCALCIDKYLFFLMEPYRQQKRQQVHPGNNWPHAVKYTIRYKCRWFRTQLVWEWTLAPFWLAWKQHKWRREHFRHILGQSI